MKHLLHALVLGIMISIPATQALSAESASKTYKVSFTIPATVYQQPDPKTLINNQQMVSLHKEIRAGQMVKIQSIVVP